MTKVTGKKEKQRNTGRNRRTKKLNSNDSEEENKTFGKILRYNNFIRTC